MDVFLETIRQLVVVLIAPALAGGVLIHPLTNLTKGLLKLSGKRFVLGEFVIEWPNALAMFWSLTTTLIVVAAEYLLVDAPLTPELAPVVAAAIYGGAAVAYKGWKKQSEA